MRVLYIWTVREFVPLKAVRYIFLFFLSPVLNRGYAYGSGMLTTQIYIIESVAHRDYALRSLPSRKSCSSLVLFLQG